MGKVVCSELIGIEYLSVEEGSLDRRQGCPHKEIDFLRVFGYGMLQFSKSMIHGVVLQQIFLQHFICPLTELSTSYGFYPVTYRNNDIKIVKLLHSLKFSFTFYSNL